MLRLLGRGVLVSCLILTSACEIAPQRIDESAQVDGFLARKAFNSACVGLDNDSNDSLRAYTAKRLSDHPHVSVATDCLCKALYDAEGHTFDAAVAEGLDGTERDDLARCLAPALDDAAIPKDKRPLLVKSLGRINAGASFEALEKLASSDSDAQVRELAASALRPCRACSDTLLGILSGDAEPNVRAAAAASLDGRSENTVVEQVTKAAVEDEDGGVRAASLTAVSKKKSSRTDKMLCDAMLEDPDERVREAAVKAVHGSKRANSIKCLEKRLLKEEESGSVREATLAALGASPSDRAAKVLCSSIGPFLRLHVKDKIADRIPGTDIIKAQNDRDWERSFDCVHKALGQGGYSCYARNYLGHWFNELGGKTSTPWCPGMARL